MQHPRLVLLDAGLVERPQAVNVGHQPGVERQVVYVEADPRPGPPRRCRRAGISARQRAAHELHGPCGVGAGLDPPQLVRFQHAAVVAERQHLLDEVGDAVAGGVGAGQAVHEDHVAGPGVRAEAGAGVCNQEAPDLRPQRVVLDQELQHGRRREGGRGDVQVEDHVRDADAAQRLAAGAVHDREHLHHVRAGRQLAGGGVEAEALRAEISLVDRVHAHQVRGLHHHRCAVHHQRQVNTAGAVHPALDEALVDLLDEPGQFHRQLRIEGAGHGVPGGPMVSHGLT